MTYEYNKKSVIENILEKVPSIPGSLITWLNDILPAFGYGFPMAGVATTMVIFNHNTNKVLLGLRGKDSDAFPNCWSLPGGYLNVGTERVRDVPVRETKEETNLDIPANEWVNFYLDDKPGDDPRYVQVINHCYCVFLDTNEDYGKVVAGDDLQEIKWVDIKEAMKTDLPFAHNKVLSKFDEYCDIAL